MASRRPRGRGGQARPASGNSADRRREQPKGTPIYLMDTVRDNIWPPRRPQSPRSPRFLRGGRGRERSESARPGPRNRRQYFPRGFDVNKMFHYIVAGRGGKCTVEELARGLNISQELIPEFVMKRGSERMKFIKADIPKKALVLAIHYNARICTFGNRCRYFPHCKFFHLCRDLVIGSCRFGYNCRNSHDVFDHHNKRIVEYSGLSSVLNENGILQVIRNSQPEICSEYNQRGGCQAIKEGGACNKFHLCQRFLKGTCLLPNCKLAHKLNSPHNVMLKACFPKDFKTLTRMMLCSDVNDVDDTNATSLKTQKRERDAAASPARKVYEFRETEDLDESEEDTKNKSVRRLVDFFERGAFSQADLSTGLSQELSLHDSYSQLSQHACTQPEWTTRMFDRNHQISRSSSPYYDEYESDSIEDEGTTELYSREKGGTSTVELQNGELHGDIQTTNSGSEKTSPFTFGLPPYNCFASTGSATSLRNGILDSIGCELDSNSTEYEEVANDFFNTMPHPFEIEKIERIVNSLLDKEYVDRKQRNRNGYLEERHLFYGAVNEEAVKSISSRGFDPQFLLTETKYGRGVCFSRDAIFSDMYAGTGPVCYMFRSKVIVGEYSEGDSFMNQPPVKPGTNGERYDSTVNSKSDPTLFIVYDRASCYPEYLIKYERKYLPNRTVPSA